MKQEKYDYVYDIFRPKINPEGVGGAGVGEEGCAKKHICSCKSEILQRIRLHWLKQGQNNKAKR